MAVDVERAEFESVLSWLDHEQRLLEILAYRIDGLTAILSTGQHRMVCQSASEVEDVRDQLANAAVRRDLVVLNLTGSRSTLMNLGELSAGATSSQQLAAEEVRQKLALAAGEVEVAQERCRLAAAAYRPTAA
ncbi:MAG TPA: hypothetical protein ENH15_01890 [Actinobacteria bacterium]|nr:hypothetical protein [Actinomycetota bacterium]